MSDISREEHEWQDAELLSPPVENGYTRTSEMMDVRLKDGTVHEACMTVDDDTWYMFGPDESGEMGVVKLPEGEVVEWRYKR